MEDRYIQIFESIDDNLKRLKSQGYEEIIQDPSGKLWLYNPSKNEKYPIIKKDWKKYKTNIEALFGELK